MSVVVVDLDGTLSADPSFYKALLRGLLREGYQVDVLTGNPHGREALAELGFTQGAEFSKVVTVPLKHIGATKVAYMRLVGATHIIDNRDKTIKLARRAGFTALHHLSPKGS